MLKDFADRVLAELSRTTHWPRLEFVRETMEKVRVEMESEPTPPAEVPTAAITMPMVEPEVQSEPETPVDESGNTEDGVMDAEFDGAGEDHGHH